MIKKIAVKPCLKWSVLIEKRGVQNSFHASFYALNLEELTNIIHFSLGKDFVFTITGIEAVLINGRESK